MSVAVPAENVATVAPVKGVFKHLDCTVEGIAALKKAGFRRHMTVMSPFPRHELEELMYEREPSPVRWFTMCGGLFGATLHFTLASMTHANWPMILPGGKPVVSIPAFTVITFEGTILWGSLFTWVALLLFCGLPARNTPKEVADPRFSNDCFGIVVHGIGASEAAKVKAILHHGAIEVLGGGDEAGGHHG